MPEVNFLVKKGLTVPKGSAATPAVIFDASDSNTGIYSPGADQVAISTGGSGRLFVDASGRVGVGTSSPTRAFDVAGGVHIGTGTNDAVIGYDEFSAGVFGLGTASTVPLVLGTTSLERLRITSAGLVGIGASSPNYTLDVAGTINANATVRTSNGTHIGILGSEAFAAGVVGVGSTSNHPLVLGTNSLERLRITSAGLVGIGTSTPSEALHVVGNGRIGNNTTNPTFTVVSSNTGNPGANTRVGTLKFAANANNVSDITAERNCGITATTGSDERFTNLDFYTSTVGGGAPRVRIDSSGNVGIGTTNPSATLQVTKNVGTSTTANLLSLRNNSASNAGNIAQIDFWCANTFGGDEPVAAIQGLNPNASSNNGGALVLAVSSSGTATTPSERARIDSSGRLLVGTSSQSGGALLQVNGDRVRIATAKTPASATDTGTAGEICWDASYVYVCTATNTWKRSALSTW